MRAVQAVFAEENVRKELSRRAVELAIQGDWVAAAGLNREIIEQYPENIESHNRLGKALMEMGARDEAAQAFRSALALSPYNGIARKNIERLAAMGSTDGPGRPQTGSRRGNGGRRTVVTEEIGKSVVVPLLNLPGPKAISRLSAGDIVELAASGRAVKATAENGSPIGQVEPRVGARLARLMAGGNRYEAAIKNLDGNGVALLIRETYHHPSQMGVVSFPARLGGGGGASAGDDDEAVSVGARTTAPKDWSDDDAEPGDDEAPPHVMRRIINSSGDPNEGF